MTDDILTRAREALRGIRGRSFEFDSTDDLEAAAAAFDVLPELATEVERLRTAVTVIKVRGTGDQIDEYVVGAAPTVHPQLAITPEVTSGGQPTGGWSLTHRPTGYVVSHTVASIDRLRDLAERLTPFEMNFDNAEQLPKMPDYEKMTALITEWFHHHDTDDARPVIHALAARSDTGRSPSRSRPGSGTAPPAVPHRSSTGSFKVEVGPNTDARTSTAAGGPAETAPTPSRSAPGKAP